MSYERPPHKYYVVVYRQSGMGSIHFLQSKRQLKKLINHCLDDGTPFKVGHEFRLTLDDGNPREEKYEVRNKQTSKT